MPDMVLRPKGVLVAREKGGFWIWFAATFFYPLCSILARRENRGTEQVPRQGGVLLVMNHISHIDPLYDAVLVHKLRRIPHFLAKESLFRPFLVGTVMRGTGQIPVYRGTSDAKDSLRDANAALAAEQVVIIYPEGTITKQPEGWPMFARTGVARLALANDVPVVPVARWGTRDILDGYHKKFRPFPRHDVITVFGEPVDLSAYRSQSPTSQTLREVTDLLMAEVTKLVAQVRGETPPTETFRPPLKGAAKAEPDAGLT
jgi:1-acyl-sn-glycerol-3-phosphate acyltransferase